jgi:hypothetical protein
MGGFLAAALSTQAFGGGGVARYGRDEAADRLRQLLADAGFNPDRPAPITAWAVFKRFAAEPMDLQTTKLWFEYPDEQDRQKASQVAYEDIRKNSFIGSPGQDIRKISHYK